LNRLGSNLPQRAADSPWHGILGKRRGRVSRKGVARLVVVMMENGFFSMPDLVRTTTDIPTLSISLKIGTVKKSVLDKNGLSKQLFEIERLIDSAGGTNRWVRSEPTEHSDKTINQ